MTVRGNTQVGLASRPHCVDWLGFWAEEEEDGQGEEEEELEYKEGGVLATLEMLGVNWLSGESHSCLKPRVIVLMSEKPSAGQLEVEGLCKAASEELTPFSAKEPEWRRELKQWTGFAPHSIKLETIFILKKKIVTHRRFWLLHYHCSEVFPTHLHHLWSSLHLFHKGPQTWRAPVPR